MMPGLLGNLAIEQILRAKMDRGESSPSAMITSRSCRRAVITLLTGVWHGAWTVD